MKSQTQDALFAAFDHHCVHKSGVYRSSRNEQGWVYKILSQEYVGFMEEIIAFVRFNTSPKHIRLRCPSEELERWLAHPSVREDSNGTEDGWVWIDFMLDEHMSLEQATALFNEAYRFCYERLGDHDKGFIKIAEGKPMTASQALETYIELNQLQHRQHEIEALYRYEILLRTTPCDEAVLGPGQSKVGGLPDLPEGMAYPFFDGKPLVFLAQVNLSEIPREMHQKPLPESGMLYFFSMMGYIGYNDFPYRQEKEPGFSQVVYFDVPRDGLRRATPPPGVKVFTTTSVEFVKVVSLPDANKYTRDPIVAKLNWTEAEFERLHALKEDFDWYMRQHLRCPRHKLLGYADSIQEAVTRPDTVLLCQFDSDTRNVDTDMMWGDGGTIYFTLPISAMDSFDLTKMIVELQCT